MERMIRLGGVIQMIGGTALAALAWARVETAAAVIFPCAMVLFGGGLVVPNCTAAALSHHPRIAGSASALLGFSQMATGATFGWVVGRLYNGTTIPMASTICAVVFASALSIRLLVRRERS
jgi:DHA1 family bicyclomycin/chloramphenicol resistance-like MFS transporter